MEIENNNEIVSFTQYLLMNNYTVRPAAGGIKKTTFLANREDKYYVIELGALGSDEMGYGIYRIENPAETDKPASEIVPITEFDPASGISI